MGTAPVQPKCRSAPVARVVVDVMPKPEILDPQGKAVHGALPRLGFDGRERRPAGQALRDRARGRGHRRACSPQVRQMAETLLSNPVIEDYDGARGRAP